ncbi:MAG: MurR/RpiR family transcriptional regulator [Caldilineaceae bacterium]|nr:MurR/RpiR family transcriptional regulator [Caldilineaceae bacterium]
MYRQKIQDHHESLSPSYRRVADYIMSRYYEVAFMTAAQLAAAVDVDTTTVVRFAQRLGYPGYPDLLQDVRGQVKEELYAVYEPAPLDSNDPAAIFKTALDQESATLRQILVHNPPATLQSIAHALAAARQVVLIGEGEVVWAARLAANHLCRRGLTAQAMGADPGQQAAVLARLDQRDAVVGICVGDEGDGVDRCLAFAQETGCRTVAVLGKLDRPTARWADEVLFVPSASAALLDGLVALTGSLLALAQAVSSVVLPDGEAAHRQALRAVYLRLTDRANPGD